MSILNKNNLIGNKKNVTYAELQSSRKARSSFNSLINSRTIRHGEMYGQFGHFGEWRRHFERIIQVDTNDRNQRGKHFL